VPGHARTLGLEVRFPPGLLDAALPVAEAVPRGDARLSPGSAFAPALTCAGGSPLDRVVAVLGRSPGWQAPGR
jgi:hypothetical protein